MSSLDVPVVFTYHRAFGRRWVKLVSKTVPKADAVTREFLIHAPVALIETALAAKSVGSYTRAHPTAKGSNDRYPYTFTINSLELGRDITVADVVAAKVVNGFQALLENVRMSATEVREHASEVFY